MPFNSRSINFILGNAAYILIVFCASVPYLSKQFYMCYRLIFGTLYPTYLSYKALKQRDDKECARMMMYWIVFAIFTFLEGFLDIFIGIWFPFYFESKIIFIFWLISPYGNGAKILYENFVHQKFEQNEVVIDDFISSIKQYSIDIFWLMWSKCSVYINYLLLLSFNKAQIAFLEYMQNQNRRQEIFNFQNPFSNFGSNNSAPNVAQIEHKPCDKPLLDDCTDAATNAEEHKPVEEKMLPPLITGGDEPPPLSDSNTKTSADEEESEEHTRPVRKTKRKRRILNIDISSRPRTRSIANKLQSSTDVEAVT